MLPKYVQGLVLGAIGGLPLMLETLLITAHAADYDKRPDPDRFTIREVLAHLADWDAVWAERLDAIIADSGTMFTPRDPSQRAIEQDYAHADFATSLAQIPGNRAALTAKFQAVADGQWERTGLHPTFGPMSLEDLAVAVVAHDNYHMRQIAEWLKA